MVHRPQAIRQLRRLVELQGRKLSNARCEEVLKDLNLLLFDGFIGSSAFEKGHLEPQKQ